MSFGFSPSDIVALIALTTKVYKGWRDALLGRLEAYVPTKAEVDASEEAEFARKEALRRDLGAVVRDARRTVASLSDVLGQYRSLGTSKRSNWDRIRLGTKNLDSLRNRLSQHLSSIGAFLTVVQLQSIDRLNQSVAGLPDLMLQRLPLALGGFIDARVSDTLSVRGGSCLTTYTNDEKDIWREFRRECVKSGIKSEQIKQNRSELRRFFKDLVEDKPQNIKDSQDTMRGREIGPELSISEATHKVQATEPAVEPVAEPEHDGDRPSSLKHDAQGPSDVVVTGGRATSAQSAEVSSIPRAAFQAYVESDDDSDIHEQSKAETANATATDDHDSTAPVEAAARNVLESPPVKAASQGDIGDGSEELRANQSTEPPRADANTGSEHGDRTKLSEQGQKIYFADTNGRLTTSLNTDADEVYPNSTGNRALRNRSLSSFRKSYNSGDIPLYPSDSEADFIPQPVYKSAIGGGLNNDIRRKSGSEQSSEDNVEDSSTSSEPEFVGRKGGVRRNLNDAASNMATIHSTRSESDRDISEPSKPMNRGTNSRKQRSRRLFVSFIAERLGLPPMMPEWHKYDEHVSEIGLPSCFICGCINGEEHESSALRDQFTVAVARFDFGSQTQRVSQKVLDSTKQQLIAAYTALLESRLEQHHAYLQTMPCYQLYQRYHGRPPIYPSQLQVVVTQIGHAEEILRSGRDEDWRRVWSLCPLLLDHFLAIEYAAQVARRSAGHSNSSESKGKRPANMRRLRPPQSENDQGVHPYVSSMSGGFGGMGGTLNNGTRSFHFSTDGRARGGSTEFSDPKDIFAEFMRGGGASMGGPVRPKITRQPPYTSSREKSAEIKDESKETSSPLDQDYPFPAGAMPAGSGGTGGVPGDSNRTFHFSTGGGGFGGFSDPNEIFREFIRGGGASMGDGGDEADDFLASFGGIGGTRSNDSPFARKRESKPESNRDRPMPQVKGPVPMPVPNDRIRKDRSKFRR